MLRIYNYDRLRSIFDKGNKGTVAKLLELRCQAQKDRAPQVMLRIQGIIMSLSWFKNSWGKLGWLENISFASVVLKSARIIPSVSSSSGIGGDLSMHAKIEILYFGIHMKLINQTISHWLLWLYRLKWSILFG
jgi:hypothetical protein